MPEIHALEFGLNLPGSGGRGGGGGMIQYKVLKLQCNIQSSNFFSFGHMACGILVPHPGIEPGPLAVKAPSPNNWTTREFPSK